MKTRCKIVDAVMGGSFIPKPCILSVQELSRGDPNRLEETHRYTLTLVSPRNPDLWSELRSDSLSFPDKDLQDMGICPYEFQGIHTLLQEFIQ